MVAFRTLGHIGHMLDLAARGEFDPEILPADKGATDELSVMASKVNLLGQRLRGAQFEVSDLRGNIDHLLQDLEDAVFIFNRELRLVFASGSVEKFLGRDRADLPGQLISDVFPPVDHAGPAGGAGVADRPRHPQPAGSGVPPAKTRSVPRWCCSRVDMLESLPGGPAAASGILVRLRDPEAQRKINRELQTADRLAAISRISSGVAHEVKNPLNAILLHVEVARAKLSRGDTDVGRADGNHLARDSPAGPRGAHVPRFHAAGGAELANVPLQELVREIVDLARPADRRGEYPGDASLQEAEGVEVRVDRDLLKQAVLNVVVNAMQAMPEGGELHFEAIGQRGYGGDCGSPTAARAFRTSCATRSSGCTSAPRRRVPESAWR